jgi:glyoxylate reductase
VSRRIVVTSPLPGGALELLRTRHDVDLLGGEAAPNAHELHSAMGDADALLCMLTDPVPREAIAAARRLQVIGNCAVGYDNIDVAAATEHGVQVVNTPNVLTDATADLAWALLLAAARRIAEADRFVRAGRFHGWRLDLLLGRPLRGRTLGIAGMGRIGSAIAERARGFGLAVLYTQRHRLDAAAETRLGARYVGKAELLAQSDFLSLCLPGGPATRRWLDRDAISALRPGAVVVNTGRGSTLDEAALADALERGHIAAAGLDVFEREPVVEPRLLALDNVVLAPHIGSATDETRSAMARAVAEDILRVLAGEAPHNPVNSPARSA